MHKSVLGSSAVLVLTSILTGCASHEDRTVREQIATLNKLAATYANVVDMASMQASEAEIGVLRKRITELDRQLTNFGPDRKDAALAKHAGQLTEARESLRAARAQAAQKAFGLQMPK